MQNVHYLEEVTYLFYLCSGIQNVMLASLPSAWYLGVAKIASSIRCLIQHPLLCKVQNCQTVGSVLTIMMVYL